MDIVNLVEEFEFEVTDLEDLEGLGLELPEVGYE